MIGYFKERNSLQLPVLVILTLALKLFIVYHPHTDISNEAGGLLPNWLDSLVLPKLHKGFATSISIVIILFSALYANYVLVSRRMFSRSNMLGGLSIILFTSLFPGSNQFNAVTLLLPMLVLLFQQIVNLYNNQKARPVIINIGIIMGSGYLLYHPFIWLLPCCFIGLGTMRPFRLTEWLLLIAGILTPAYFLLSYEFLSNQWNPAQHAIHWHTHVDFRIMDVYAWAAAAIAGTWFLAGLIAWQNNTRRMLIQARKNWYLLLFFSIFILPVALFPAANIMEAATLISFPVGSLAANAFSNPEKKRVPLIFFWCIIIAVVFISYNYV